MESVDKAGEFVQQLMEQSSKEVFGTSCIQIPSACMDAGPCVCVCFFDNVQTNSCMSYYKE